MNPRPELAWGGVIGPTAFVAAWATAGAVAKGYSPVQQSISRLAAVDAPKRRLMTAGFICFGVTVPAYGVVLRDSLGGRAWMAAMVSGVATLGAGAFALDRSSATDRTHYGLAVVASSSLALTPILAAPSLSVRGLDRAAAASRLIGVFSGVCLAGPAFLPAEGVLQRIGLTLAQGWIAASAVAIVGGFLETA